jgi:hypothetical protein
MRDRELHTIDALDELGVAPSLASSDFYRRASQSLTADGALVGRIRSAVASRAPTGPACRRLRLRLRQLNGAHANTTTGIFSSTAAQRETTFV